MRDQGIHSSIEPTVGGGSEGHLDQQFTDDRLTLVLNPLSDPETWDRIEVSLWDGTCEVYALPLERVRLDSTTSYGFHTIIAGGLMQLGHSKDHRLTWTVPEAARLLGISKDCAYDAARRGDLPVRFIGRRVVVPRTALLRLLDEAHAPDQQHPPPG